MWIYYTIFNFWEYLIFIESDFRLFTLWSHSLLIYFYFNYIKKYCKVPYNSFKNHMTLPSTYSKPIIKNYTQHILISFNNPFPHSKSENSWIWNTCPVLPVVKPPIPLTFTNKGGIRVALKTATQKPKDFPMRTSSRT